MLKSINMANFCSIKEITSKKRKSYGRNDVESKNGSNNQKKNTNWWIWIVVAIIGLLLAWIALSERSDVGDVETPEEPVVAMMRFLDTGSSTTA